MVRHCPHTANYSPPKKIAMKALSDSMLEVLMNCHEKEIQQQAPVFGLSSTQHLKGLITRKFIEAKMTACNNTGKLMMTYSITEAGKQFLDKYMKKMNPVR